MHRHWPFLLLLVGCQEYSLFDEPKDDAGPTPDTDVGYGLCSFPLAPRTTDTLPTCGAYNVGGFTPWVEFHAARGYSSTALPAVADLDGDGIPEIIANVVPGLGVLGKGELWAIHGDGSGELWKVANANIGYGSSPSVGDIDGDGDPEIIVVRAPNSQNPIGNSSTYKLVAYDHEGNELWVSAAYTKNNFDYATAPIISDMDHDGAVEIIAGRVIFHADGTERGKGRKGRGSSGLLPGNASESSVPAVADLDLDGTEEVIVGNAMYSPDGDLVWEDTRPGATDGMIGIGNLDDDPEGEFIVSTGATVRAHDTDGTKIWGPYTLDGANIVSPSAIGDIDNDGYAEVVVAGGNQIVALNHDGTVLWTQGVQDESGATGASLFDFDGDGIQEVVYVDEIRVYAFNGSDGVPKFVSDEHASPTMMDYPVIADVDADGSAEIVVVHSGYAPPGGGRIAAVTVYGAGDGRWAPTRKVWNQHAYSIDNVRDDLTIPTTAVQGFTTHNSWHSATDDALYDQEDFFDLQVEIKQTCDLQCDLGAFFVAVQPINRSPDLTVAPGVALTLYGVRGSRLEVLDTQSTGSEVLPGYLGEPIIFQVNADRVRTLDAIRVVIDDTGNGSGWGAIAECVEDDNSWQIQGPFCN